MSSTAVMARKARKRPLADGARPVPPSLAYLEDAGRWLDLDFFPTPPWATRALLRHALPAIDVRKIASAWEPACGLGHMSDVLKESIATVVASDVNEYRPDTPRHNFLEDPPHADGVDWIITNPPFARAAEFLERALPIAREGVAFFCRLAWLESEGRYHNLWLPTPPTAVAPFVERVSLCCGGWDPALKSATAYAWFIWNRDSYVRGDGSRLYDREFRVKLIPPGCREGLSRPQDQLLAARHVPGWVAPSLRATSGDAQMELSA